MKFIKIMNILINVNIIKSIMHDATTGDMDVICDTNKYSYHNISVRMFNLICKELLKP